MEAGATSTEAGLHPNKMEVDLPPWKLVEASMEEDVSGWKQMGASMEVDGSCASMEVDGSRLKILWKYI